MRRAALLLLLLSACARRPVPEPESPPGAAPTAQTSAPPPSAPADVTGKTSASQGPQPAAPPRPVTLVVGGDVTVGYHYEEYFDQQVAQGRSREEMFAYGFKEVKAVADSADLFLVNLECPFTDSLDKLPKNFNFRARPEFVNTLLAGGVDLVSLANNHMMDYGAQGLVDTLMTLEQAKIPYFGAGRTLAEARRPALLTLGGVRFAFLGYFFLGDRNIEPRAVYATETTPGVAGHHSDVDAMERMLREDILAAKAQADVVLPFFHWGVESTYNPLPYQLRLARAAIEAGAAGVLGSHPHVLQAMELHQGAPAIYSLGNFVFGGNWNPRDKRSALLKARFSPGGYLSSEIIPLRTDRYPEFPMQPIVVSGTEAEDVLKLLATSSAALPRMLPELEPYRPASPPP
ncbi:CapA family protein [Hyalangium gracile]|uniref:CapA family protein n=1 Tax=Hyalangium gracile TaxID=394092 RepID=UPI001CCFBC34|nr:CapA family protein [Hyalangium gracile]